MRKFAPRFMKPSVFKVSPLLFCFTPSCFSFAFGIRTLVRWRANSAAVARAEACGRILTTRKEGEIVARAFATWQRRTRTKLVEQVSSGRFSLFRFALVTFTHSLLGSSVS